MKSKYFCVIGIIGSILFSCKQGESVSRVLLDEISFSEKEQVINCAGNQFSFDLFRQLSSLDSAENMFVSPFSVSCALGMVNYGASGVTHQEIMEVMQIPDSVALVLNAYHQKLIDGLPRLDSSVTVKIANSMWFNKEVPVKKQFIQKNAMSYKAVSHNLDFSKLESVDKINEWVSRQTEGCIRKFMSNLSSDELLVLVNCLYFKGKWKFPFEKSETRKEVFFLCR